MRYDKNSQNECFCFAPNSLFSRKEIVSRKASETNGTCSLKNDMSNAILQDFRRVEQTEKGQRVILENCDEDKREENQYRLCPFHVIQINFKPFHETERYFKSFSAVLP